MGIKWRNIPDLFAPITEIPFIQKRNESKNQKIYSNKISIFIYSFIILLFTELFIRYTGLSYILRIFYIILPVVLCFFFYFLLNYKFSRETLKYEKFSI